MAVRLAPRVWSLSPGEAAPADAPPGAFCFVQHPARAFGDGSHPTTRMCARAVDLLCRQHQPRAVLDVGCGTAILARIARAHGAARVMGTDIDPEALKSARANVAEDGSAVPIALTDAAPDAQGPVFDLVVANILEGPLLDLAPALAGALAPKGALLLSGFLAPQAPALVVRFEALGLVHKSTSTSEGWALVHLVRAARAKGP